MGKKHTAGGFGEVLFYAESDKDYDQVSHLVKTDNNEVKSLWKVVLLREAAETIKNILNRFQIVGWLYSRNGFGEKSSLFFGF